MDRQKNNLTLILPLARLVSVVHSSGTIGSLQENYNLSILTPLGVRPPGEFEAFHYQESRLGRYFREALLNANTMRLSHSVISFRTRIKMILNLEERVEEGHHIKWIFSLSLFFKPRALLSFILYKFFSSGLMKDTAQSVANLWPSLEKTLSKTDPSIVVVFSGGAFSGVENAILEICLRKKIRSVLIVDNWDNLSSKSIFWSSPDALGVWGANMELDARLIHGMSPSILHHIGSARFRPNENQISETSQKFIFFAGSGKPLFNELRALKRIRQILDSIGKGEVDLVYRPHPMSNIARSEIEVEIGSLRGVQLDSSLSGDLHEDFYKEAPLRHLEYLCQNSILVIAPLSSIIVESLSLGTPVVSLNWRADKSTTSPLDEYTHFWELRGKRGFFPVTSWQDLEDSLPIALGFGHQENLVPEILPTFVDSYSERVLALVKALEIEVLK